MRIVAQFDPSTETEDTFNAGFSNGTGRIVVYNQSPQNLNLTWGAFSTYCPAWTAMLYCISTSTVNLGWEIDSTLANQTTPPISQVTVEAFDAGEPITGTYPASLMHQTSIGNAINLMTSTTNIVNDGNASLTQIIESKVSGNVGSDVILTNNGDLALGSPNAAGSLAIQGTLGASFVVNRNGKLTTTGAVSTPQVQLAIGSFSRISTFSGTANTSFANYNHGLGVTPDVVIIQFVGSAAGDAATFSYNPATMTNTTVAITCNDATPRSFVALAIKF